MCAIVKLRLQSRGLIPPLRLIQVGGSPKSGNQPRGQESHRISEFLHTAQEEKMRLNAPTQVVWIIALILGIVGILATLVTIPVITPVIGFWLVVAGWALLLIATVLRRT
jgi:hypothetical protein